MPTPARMNKLLLAKLSFFLVLGVLASCGPTRNLVYFSDLKGDSSYKATVEQSAQIVIQSNDLLSIRLVSLNPESNLLFNRGVLQTPNSSVTGPSAEAAVNDGYLVDSEGFINYPVLGKVKLGGLTKEVANAKMTKAIQEYVKSPIVTIRLLNFKVTVIGEVNKPSTFVVPTERINVLEALGLAGDMTPFGRRENVLLVRERDGVRSTTRLDLNNKELLNSPYFYLQQNDVLYVEPDRIKEVQASTNTRTLTIASLGVSVLVALVFNFQNIFK